MCLQEFSTHELTRLANRLHLEIKDYERLAMAVFGNLLAKQRAHAALWNKRAGGLISFYAYESGRKKIEDPKVVDICWRRLRQDLYEGNRAAIVGVQCALYYAKREGFSADPLWGGERRREAERVLHRQGIDLNAPPGLTYDPKEREERRPPERKEVVTPEIYGSEMKKLTTAEQLGIADFWLELPDEERFLLNAILEGLEQPAPAQRLRKLAGDRVYERVDERDIPYADNSWLRDFPEELADVVEKLPDRSQAILATRYRLTPARDVRALHDAITGELIRQRHVDSDRLLSMVMRELCNSRDSIGARLRYEMQLDQQTMSFNAFVSLCQGHLPKLAAAERNLAARHERSRRAQLDRELVLIAADPGNKHIAERYAQMWKVANRSTLEEFGAGLRGFGKAAYGTVEGIVVLLTTDPRKTAAGLYHLATHPEILVNALDDAMVDHDEMAGALLFELASAAVGAGPASKLSQVQKAARLAKAAENAAAAGKLRAAKRFADAAESALDKARKSDVKPATGEAEHLLSRARAAIDDKAKDAPGGGAPAGKGYSPDSPAPGGDNVPTPGKPMRDNLRHRYRHVPLGGHLVKGTKHIFIQGPSAEFVRRIDVRFRQLQRFEEGRQLIKALDDALERTSQADVDAAVAQATKAYNFDKATQHAERTRLLRDNRRNRRVVVQWIGEKDRIECRELVPDQAHRNDVAQQASGGSGSVVRFDPDRWKHIMDDGSELRPPTPAIALGHELIHALRHATGRATKSRMTEEWETIGLEKVPDWAPGPGVTENELRKGWARLQKSVAELRTDY